MDDEQELQIELVSFGELTAEMIHFSIKDHGFSMIFTPVRMLEDECIKEKECDLSFPIPENSYDVKFDRHENIEDGNYYDSPGVGFSKFGLSEMSLLGRWLVKIVKFHEERTEAELYLAEANNQALNVYYARLARRHADGLGYEVYKNLGSEGKGYAIKTQRFKTTDRS